MAYCIFIAAECGENIRYIPFRNGSDTVQIRLADVRCSIAKHLLNGDFFDFDTKAVQHGIFSSDHTLVHTKLLCPTTALHRLFIVDIENVHGAVSDVCKEIGR